jgi:hypothetical protein
MNMVMRSFHPTIHPRPRARGFAFTEILFAVMVLALGFIMIAAMFPVTIRQTQSTMEEATAASVAKGAIDYLQTIASEDRFPFTVPVTTPISHTGAPDPTLDRPAFDADASVPAEVVSLKKVMYTNPRGLGNTQIASWGGFPAYSLVRGNMIDPRNPRVAWVPLYRREYNSPFAQVFVIVVQSRNRDQYVPAADLTGQFPDRTYSDLDPPPASAVTEYATLDPRRIVVGVEWDNTAKHGVIKIEPDFRALAAPGAFIVIARDPNSYKTQTSKAGQWDVGKSNGRIYQLGNPIDEAAGTWEITPGSDMTRTNTADQSKLNFGDDNDLPLVTPESAASTIAYIIGRGYTNPNTAADGYSGPAQEIGVYTGYIHIPPVGAADIP